MRRTLLVALLATGASLAAAAPARAYVREFNQDQRYQIIWPDPAVTVTVRTGGPQIVSADDFITAASNAAAAWSDPALDASVLISVAHSPDLPADPAFDHQNTIAFRADVWDTATGHSPGQLALTTVWTQGGRIVDTDTEINAKNPAFKWALLPDDPVAAAALAEVDLQAALTHELGHVLGLDHPCYLGDKSPSPPEVSNLGAAVPSCADPTLPMSVLEATMYPSADNGSIAERTLSSDEILALHDLYPAGHAPVVQGDSPASSGGCAVAGGAARSPAAALAAAAFFAMTAYLARRRRPRADTLAPRRASA
jgi:hypothetical protein